MRLIDADALLRKLPDPLESYITGVEPGMVSKHDIDAAPAVDAAPVVRGKWVSKKNPRWPAHSHDCCSRCGWWNTRNALCYDGAKKPGHSLNYCPNCGAKMDEEG